LIDIRKIREKTEDVKDAIRSLQAEAPIDEIIVLDEKRRLNLQELEDLRHERNVTSKEIGRMKDAAAREELIEKMGVVNDRVKTLESELREVEVDLERAMYLVPNLPHESVPVGVDESENIVLRQEGEPKTAEQFEFEPLPHWDLGPNLGIIDFERGVKLSGTRFYVLFGLGARLERALIHWMLDFHTEKHGYTEVYTPAIVREACMWGAGQLPKFCIETRSSKPTSCRGNMWPIPLASAGRSSPPVVMCAGLSASISLTKLKCIISPHRRPPTMNLRRWSRMQRIYAGRWRSPTG
jgi:seryl-tRNA synthetase